MGWFKSKNAQKQEECKPYVEISKVKKCAADEDLEFWRGKRVYIGLDLSQTDDNTSVAGVDYKALINDGVCFACGVSAKCKRDIER